MNDQLFAPVSKKKFLAYGAVYVAVLLLWVALMAFLGDPLPGLLRGVGVVALLTSILLAGGIWLVGGEKTEVRIGSSITRVPTRLRDATPLIVSLLILSQLLKLLAILSSKLRKSRSSHKSQRSPAVLSRS
jgi:hypothetical protein